MTTAQAHMSLLALLPQKTSDLHFWLHSLQVSFPAQHGYKTPIKQWSDRALAKPEGATWNTWTFLETYNTQEKTPFEKKIILLELIWTSDIPGVG